MFVPFTAVVFTRSFTSTLSPYPTISRNLTLVRNWLMVEVE